MGSHPFASALAADDRATGLREAFRRRIEAAPPSMRPAATLLSLLQASHAQTCGKCVPCRDGIPELTRLLQSVLAHETDKAALRQMESLALSIRDSADCAIGCMAATHVLDSLDIVEGEFESGLEEGGRAQDIAKLAPCEALCPAHVNVPAYIALVSEGRYADAVRTIREDNPFPTACALVCEHPCEKRCRRTLVDAPLNIRGIKQFAVDHAPSDTVPVPKRMPDSGKAVAVVGGGPSGLSCAYYLALMGHRVSVFEGRKQLGGMLRYGIPAYRLPRERLDEDIRAILSVGGIEVELGHPIDDGEMAALMNRFDAVYLAIGAQNGKSLALDNIDAKGVFPAVELLGSIGDGTCPDFAGKRVVVVGGGNVAMDCCRTSVRAGAKEVSCVYRRRLEDMTALPEEVEDAVAEGVEMITLEAPSAIEANAKGEVCGLRTQPQAIGKMAHGRPTPRNADKPENLIEADIALVAVGQSVACAPFERMGIPIDRGRFKTNGLLAIEGFEGVFAGGDCQTGPATAIMAIGAGKDAAFRIDEYLGCRHVLDSDVEVPAAAGNDTEPKGRANMAKRRARERKRDFDCVEGCLSLEEVEQECGRCLRCDCFGSSTMEGRRAHHG